MGSRKEGGSTASSSPPLPSQFGRGEEGRRATLPCGRSATSTRGRQPCRPGGRRARCSSRFLRKEARQKAPRKQSDQEQFKEGAIPHLDLTVWLLAMGTGRGASLRQLSRLVTAQNSLLASSNARSVGSLRVVRTVTTQLLSLDMALTGGIRPYAPRHAQYDTWSEGIPRAYMGQVLPDVCCPCATNHTTSHPAQPRSASARARSLPCATRRLIATPAARSRPHASLGILCHSVITGCHKANADQQAPRHGAIRSQGL